MNIQVKCSSFPLAACALVHQNMVALLPCIAASELHHSGISEVRLDFLKQPERRICLASNHTNEACSEWFSNCALADEGEQGFEFHHLPKRETLTVQDSAHET